MRANEANRQGLGLLVFLPAVFLSAFLVFQIQPLISKYILPWYGGTATVWTTCLLVFQTLLFAGYAYAHALGRLNPRAQAATHVLLLFAAASISIVPAETWKPAGDENPQLRIVSMLLLTVGLPYFALSATGPLLQSWFWRVQPGRSPYPLYALSNAGSLLALLSYPVIFEPKLSGLAQAALWRGGFFVFVLLSALGALLLWTVRPGASAAPGAPDGGTDRAPAGGPPLSARVEIGLWIAWSACSVILFMSVTNQITLNIAAVPFLWILPLSVYLLTFIFAFAGSRWYPRRVFAVLFAISIVALFVVLQTEVSYGKQMATKFSLLQQVSIYGAALFVLCLVCHGELYRSRPAPARLTTFYLSIAFGGALGGIIVGVLAPAAFLLYQELHLGMLACSVLFLFSSFRDPESRLYRGGARRSGALLLAGIVGLAGLLAYQTWSLLENTLITKRNFFGLLRVEESGRGDPSTHSLKLYDGAVLHGHQFVVDQLRRLPTVYYTSLTGVGGLFTDFSRPAGRRVGIIGLGAGGLAGYGEAGDVFRFYEINPDVIEIAREQFTFLEDSAAEVEIALGDARLKLEAEPDQEFDILVLDAFSSDSVPVHLLTREAFEVYARHVNPAGAIALNISNQHMDLSPIVFQLAEQYDFHALAVHNDERPEQVTLAATWMILSRDPELLNGLVAKFRPLVDSGIMVLADRAPERFRDVRPWTDNQSNLFQILR